jgi:hypothetical protein
MLIQWYGLNRARLCAIGVERSGHGKYCHLDFTSPPQESLSWGTAYFSGAVPTLQHHEHIESDLRIALKDSMPGQGRRLENTTRATRFIGNSKHMQIMGENL